MNNDLWKLLGEYEVVVPIIQRDYAQGRKDKKYIRRTFLTEIKSYLCENKAVTLDFVYGNIEGTRFYPLDGQQRLTTLWLIYWYVSFRTGELEADCQTLKKFTYETRSSSGDFCTALCEKMQGVTYDDVDGYDGIVEFIKARTWFYSSWLQDPTVSAMLRTLGGDAEKSDDNIEAIFVGCDYDQLRDRLIKHPIIDFELMIIGGEKLPISDDLYIKMNARGKGLTDFENLKADLVAWIQSADNPDSAELEKTVNSNSISYKQYYPSQIDNKWTDVFWNSAREKSQAEFDGRFDELYFLFINRFVLNKICINSSMSPAEYVQGKEDEAHKEEKVAFDRLFGTGLRGSSADDSLVNYENFEAYKKYITFQALDEIDYILETVSDATVLKTIESALAIRDVDKDDDETPSATSGYTFIPQYCTGKEHDLIPTRQKERVYFLAVCSYILNSRIDNKFDKTKFIKWMRVVKNLTENAAIANVSAMVICMRLIKSLSDKMLSFNNDIYECLKDYAEPFSNTPLGLQLKEEKEKAEKILTDTTWEDKIKEAENFAFFNGTIRFLYRNVSAIEWNDFDKKFETAKKLFRSSASDRRKAVKISTIEKLLKQFTGFEEIENECLFTSVGYDARLKCWKKEILCSGNDKVLNKIHSLLLNSAEPSHDNDYQAFLDCGLIEKIVSKSENYKYRYRRYFFIRKDYSQTEGVYVSAKRKEKNEALKKLVDDGIINITDDIFNSYQSGYYWGLRVEFEYAGSKYRWYESSENGDRVDKICRVNAVNDKESANAFVWVDHSDLLRGINSFPNWD